MQTLSAEFVNFLNNSLGIWYLIILNAFGVIAIFLKVSEYQFKQRKYILLFAGLVSLCWLLYFLMQGDFVSTGISVIGIIQTIIFYQRDKRAWANNKFWLYLFMAIQLIIGVITFKKWFDVFAVIAGVSGTIAYFVTDKRVYRYISLVSMTTWILNGVFKFYLLALLHDTFATVSIIIAIIRFEVLNKEKSTIKSDL